MKVEAVSNHACAACKIKEARRSQDNDGQSEGGADLQIQRGQSFSRQRVRTQAGICHKSTQNHARTTIANSSCVFATYNPWALVKAAAPPRPHRHTAPSGLAELESQRAVQLSSPSVAPATCGRNPIPYGAYEHASVET